MKKENIFVIVKDLKENNLLSIIFPVEINILEVRSTILTLLFNLFFKGISRRDDIESLAYVLLYFDTQGEIFDLFKGQDVQAWKASTPADKMHPKATRKTPFSPHFLNFFKR